MEPPVVGRDALTPVVYCCWTWCRPTGPIAVGACSTAVFTRTSVQHEPTPGGPGVAAGLAPGPQAPCSLPLWFLTKTKTKNGPKKTH
jgi:hypothetical protein